MLGARIQQSGVGGSGACLLTAILLCFSVLPLHAQDYTSPQRSTLKSDIWSSPEGHTTQSNRSLSNEPCCSTLDLGRAHLKREKKKPSCPLGPADADIWGIKHMHPECRCLPAGIVSTVCGRTKFQGKIYGDQRAGPERWPWQASVLFRGRHVCGAVLFDKNWLVSAAHCFQRSNKPSDYQILLGYHQLSNPTKYSRQKTVNMLIVHENFNKSYIQGNDIILIQLHKPVNYTSHIFPACIPEETTKVPLDSHCWISGWGMLKEDKFLPAPFTMQDAEVFLINEERCEGFFQTPQTSTIHYKAIKDDMICAGDLENGKSFCQGDSGGSLVCLLDRSWYVVGVASWNTACLDRIASPNIFTNISYFSNWIKEKKEDTPDADPHSGPPEENAMGLIGWESYSNSLSIRPIICTALLSSLVLLLQSAWLRNL